ncbi:MAG: Gfo/Idh/MocA family oxidoreductase [Pirellulaceae bacterium]|nr:Gfo/Idh/MocA family oxidoreductase [Pirellulaceae bacterium]
MTCRIDHLAAIAYLPQSPVSYSPNIGLIGCGGIAGYHLQAYQAAGFKVTALADLDKTRATARRDDYFPDALATDDFQKILGDDSIEVVDITTHPAERVALIRAALMAGKHVLSQKPFVLDLDVGFELVELAAKQGRYLAVNQNGRWAPHFSYARLVAGSGMIGNIFGVHMSCHWDHRWVRGTPFEQIRHLILYDYAIHWFDMVRCFLPERKAQRVFASTARAAGQDLKPNLLAQSVIEFEDAQATLAFDACVPAGPQERTYLSGTNGSLTSSGSGNQEQRLTVNLTEGSWTPTLTGKWFPDGFHGTMGELLCAIEQKRPCSIDAADNLESLALCFAAVASAESGLPVRPGAVRKMPTNPPGN